MIAAARAIRWSLVQGGPRVALGPCRTSSARAPSIALALAEDRLGVIDVELPAAGVGGLGELLAIHDRVGPGLVRRLTLDGDVLRKVQRPASQ